MTFRDLFDALYADTSGVVELRSIRELETEPIVQRAFAPPSECGTLRDFLTAHRASSNLYFGVATRKDASAGTAQNCWHLPALFVDLDFKDLAETTARQRLSTFSLPPSIGIQSGHGLHLYWLSREPIDLTTDAGQTQSLLRRLSAYFDADRAAAEIARVLRVPGGLNRKYTPPRPVVIEWLDGSRRYNASEFDELLPPESRRFQSRILQDTNPVGRVATTTPDGKIRTGQRHRTFMSLAGTMRNRGMSAGAIEAALLVENHERCDVPLPHAEVCRMAQDAGRYTPAGEEVVDDEPLVLTKLDALMQEPDEVHRWLVDDRFAYASVNLICGRPKSGKSTLARALAFSVARGERWLGATCQPGHVVYLALEDKRTEIRRHLRMLGATGAEPIRLLIGRAPRNLLSRLTTLAATGDAIDLLIVDTAQRLLTVKDSNDYALVTAAFEPVLALARTHGTCIVLLHHAGKADRAGLEAVMGSTAWAASVDNVLLLNRTERYRLLSSVQRIGPDLTETVVLMDEATGEVRLGGGRYLTDLSRVTTAMVELVQAAGSVGIRRDDLIGDVDARRELKLTAVQHLMQVPQIERFGRGTKNDPYRYRSQEPQSDESSKSDSGLQVPKIAGNLNSSLSPKSVVLRDLEVPEVPQVPEVVPDASEQLPRWVTEPTPSDYSDPIGTHDADDDGCAPSRKTVSTEGDPRGRF